MDKFRIFVVSSLCKPPVELDRTKDEQTFSCIVTMPLPPQLLIFSQGQWPPGVEATLDICLGSNKIGEMKEETKCFTWMTNGLETRPAGEKMSLEITTNGMKTPTEQTQASKKKRGPVRKTKSAYKSSSPQEQETDKSPAQKPAVKKCDTDIQKTKVDSEHTEQEKDSKSAKVDCVSLLTSKKEKPGRKKKNLPQALNEDKKKSITEEKNKLNTEEKKTLMSDEKKKSTSSATQVKKTKQTQLNFSGIKTVPQITSDKKLENKENGGDKSSPVVKQEEKTSIKTKFSPGLADLNQEDIGSKKTKSSSEVKDEIGNKKTKSTPEVKEGKGNKKTKAIPVVRAPQRGKGIKTKAADKPKAGESPKQTEGKEEKDERCEAQVLNESTPQLADMPSPLPRKPAKQKRKRNKDELSPEGPTPKKRGTRMRALTSEGTPKSSRPKAVLGEIPISENLMNIEEDVKTPMQSDGRLTRWVDLSARAPRPSARWGHTMMLTRPRCAVLIGGQGDRQQLSRDSVWKLHTETRKWQCEEVQSEGQKPENRMGHTATYDPTMRCIYIFGGSKNSRWFHDVHMYDLDENKWTLAKVDGKAPTRAYHTVCLHRHELWVFGGVYPRPDPNPDGCSNDIYIFSPVMQSWYCPPIQGDKPLARSGHSATLIKDQMVMFGGWDAPFCYNDLYILDLTTVDWSKPDVKGMPPKPRSWHASCALSNQRILIHGGYDGDNALEDSFIFDLDNLSWSRLVVPSAPKARAGHAAISLPYSHENQEEDEVLVFGGGDNDGEFFSDLLSFSIPFNPVVEV